MRRRIIKISATSFGITISPTFLELLGIENPKEASSYTLDISFKDNSLVISHQLKTEEEQQDSDI